MKSDSAQLDGNTPNAPYVDLIKASLVQAFGEEKAAELGLDIQNFLNILIGWRNVRPWSEFFGVFKMPQADCDLLKQRLATNLLHYRSNYLFLCAGIFSLRAIFAPTMFLSLLLCSALAIYFLLIAKMPIVVGEYTFRHREKVIFLSCFSILFMTLTGALVRLIWTLLMMVALCLAHMTFRPRSVTAKTDGEEIKLNGFFWFGGANSPDTEDVENPNSAESSIIDRETDIRKRTVSTINK